MSLWLSPVIAIVLLAPPEAPAVRLTLEPGLRCGLGGAIGSALSEQQVRVAAESDSSAWVVSVQGEGEAVLLRITNPQGAVRGVRRLKPTDADCPTLPRTVALLVKSWLAMQLRAANPVEVKSPTGISSDPGHGSDASTGGRPAPGSSLAEPAIVGAGPRPARGTAIAEPRRTGAEPKRGGPISAPPLTAAETSPAAETSVADGEPKPAPRRAVSPLTAADPKPAVRPATSAPPLTASDPKPAVRPAISAPPLAAADTKPAPGQAAGQAPLAAADPKPAPGQAAGQAPLAAADTKPAPEQAAAEPRPVPLRPLLAAELSPEQRKSSGELRFTSSGAGAGPPSPPELRAPVAPEYSVAQPGPREPRAPSSRSLSALLAGGGSLGLDAPVVPVARGTLTLEWGFLEPWGVSLDGGLETERRRTYLDGSVSVALRWATLSLRRAFLADQGRGLHVSLGVQLVQLAATSRGFTVSNSREVLLPAAAANVEWRQPITGGLFLLARLGAQLRLRPETFSIDRTVVVTVPAWGLGLEAGVGWKFL